MVKQGSRFERSKFFVLRVFPLGFYTACLLKIRQAFSRILFWVTCVLGQAFCRFGSWTIAREFVFFFRKNGGAVVGGVVCRLWGSLRDNRWCCVSGYWVGIDVILSLLLSERCVCLLRWCCADKDLNRTVLPYEIWIPNEAPRASQWDYCMAGLD